MAELRQRKPTGENGIQDEGAWLGEDTKKTPGASGLAAKIQLLAEKAAPFTEKAVKGLEVAWPYFVKAKGTFDGFMVSGTPISFLRSRVLFSVLLLCRNVLSCVSLLLLLLASTLAHSHAASFGPPIPQVQAAEHHLFEDLIPALCGLAMAFFGGVFPDVIAAVVAFRVSGTVKKVTDAFLELGQEATLVLEKSAEEDKAAEADATQGSASDESKANSGKELLQKKALLVLRTVDPEKVDKSLVAISVGLLAVISTIKLQFARCLALGHSLGATLERPASRYATPLLKDALPGDYHRWIAPGITYSCRLIAMTAAFWLQRIISAVHSAVQGGQLFTSRCLPSSSSRCFLVLLSCFLFLPHSLPPPCLRLVRCSMRRESHSFFLDCCPSHG